MKLFSVIKDIFQNNNIKIVERLSTIEASFSIALESLPDADSIQSICSLVPTRDTLRFSFTTDSGDILVATSKTGKCDFSTFIKGLHKEDCIKVSIQIDKTVSMCRYSVYDFSSFIEDLHQRQVSEIMQWFSDLLHKQDYLMFDVFDYDISLSTKTMAFESNEKATFEPTVNRNQRLSVCKENAYFYNMSTYEIIPDDFIIEGIIRDGDCLTPLFGKIATILSLAYIASSATINDGIINIQISGQRTTNHELMLDDIQDDENWLSIYSWIFTDGNPTDKILLAHNVISLHCKYEPLLKLDTTVFDAIRTNYNLYLRNNVNQYLDMKREISKFIQNVVAQVGDYAVAVLGKFKTNLFAMAGFLFTVVLTRIGDIQEWNELFTRDTIYLFEIFIIGSLVYLLICVFETRYKLQKTKQGYRELKENYEDVLSDAEIKEAFKDDKLFSETEKIANRGILSWSFIWGGLLVVILLIIETLTAHKGLLVLIWHTIRNL